MRSYPVDAFPFFPHSLVLDVIFSNMCSLSILLSISPTSFVFDSVIPSELSNSMWKVILKHSLVITTIRIRELAFQHVTIIENAFKNFFSFVEDDSFSMVLPIFKIALINVILVYELAFSFVFILIKISDIHPFFLFVFFSPKTFFLIIFPSPIIYKFIVFILPLPLSFPI
jgi:hypothetical protein